MQDEKIKVDAEISFQRSKIYRLLSYCFFYPDKELMEFLKSNEFWGEMKVALEGIVNTFPLLKKELTMPLIDPKGIAIDLARIIDEHIRFFTLKSGCPPYETEYYMSGASAFSTEEMADIAGFYKAFGMDFVRDRPDYITTELEFMYMVTMMESEASFKGEAEKVEVCKSVEKKFLNDHLGRWVNAFSDSLISEGSSFYSSISLFLRHWIDMECRYLNVSPQKITYFKIDSSEGENQVCLGEAL